ncbi:MAG: AMP-binding protein, partial [Desulfobacterales bacterium]
MTSPRFTHIYQAFEAVADRRGDHTAVIYLGTRFSYRRVADLAERLAAALIDLGAGEGRKVILYVPNSIQWVVAWLGILRAGGICVPITPIYTPHDLKYIATDSDAETVVCSDTNYGYVRKVLAETPLRQVIIVKTADMLPSWKRGFGYLFDIVPRGTVSYGPHTHSFRTLLHRYRNR